MLIRILGTIFSEILSEIHTFSFTQMHLKMSSAKWWHFCLGLNVLKTVPCLHYMCVYLMQVYFIIVHTVFTAEMVLLLLLYSARSWRVKVFAILFLLVTLLPLASSADSGYRAITILSFLVHKCMVIIWHVYICFRLGFYFVLLLLVLLRNDKIKLFHQFIQSFY